MHALSLGLRCMPEVRTSCHAMTCLLNRTRVNRMWVSGAPRTKVSDTTMRKRARAKAASIERREMKTFRKYVAKRWNLSTDEAIDACIAENEMMPHSRSVYYDEGSVRKPFHCLGDEGVPEIEELDPHVDYSYETEEENSNLVEEAGFEEMEDGAAKEPIKRVWRRISQQQHEEVARLGSYKGMEDPAFGRWKRHELPPYIDERMFPANMPKTTEVRLRPKHPLLQSFSSLSCIEPWTQDHTPQSVAANVQPAPTCHIQPAPTCHARKHLDPDAGGCCSEGKGSAVRRLCRRPETPKRKRHSRAAC